MAKASLDVLAWSSCAAEKKACVGWIEAYLGDCVCDSTSEASFWLGMVGLVCWGVAEIPQIVTNFLKKSAHGVSLTFLLTWVAGDIFNLVGCLLEPATLPTQFYTALLYTATTIVLVLQTIYYNFLPKCWNKTGFEPRLQEERKPLNQTNTNIMSQYPIPTVTADVFYTSARSLTRSGTPPHRSSSYLGPVRSGPSAMGCGELSSSDEDQTSPQLHKSRRTRGRKKRSRPLSRSVGYGTFVTCAVSFPFQARALMQVGRGFAGEFMQIQEERRSTASEENPIGILLGWIMAAIYMGGRLPQIYLNIKRGSVEGLNPLMFMFALVANATYVGSILLRSVEWERIKGNAPWLLDAIVCVMLDLFIIVQFVVYSLMRKEKTRVINEDRL